MILITGGAWQGKREYAYSLMEIDSDKKLIIEGDRCTPEDMKNVQIVDQLHLWIRKQMEELMPQAAAGTMNGVTSDGVWDETVFDQQEMLLAQEKITRALDEVMEANPDVILIVNELGCGVIPMEVFDRRYRELVGRTSCELAKKAKEVHRVVCGVGTVIKAEEKETETTDPAVVDAEVIQSAADNVEAGQEDVKE